MIPRAITKWQYIQGRTVQLPVRTDAPVSTLKMKK